MYSLDERGKSPLCGEGTVGESRSMVHDMYMLCDVYDTLLVCSVVVDVLLCGLPTCDA